MAVVQGPTVQELFKSGAFPEHQHWITHELHRPLGTVIELLVQVEMIEEPSDTRWVKLRPGAKTYYYTFADGTQCTYGGVS